MLSSELIPTQDLVLAAFALLSSRSSASSASSRMSLARLLILAPASSPVTGSMKTREVNSRSFGANLVADGGEAWGTGEGKELVRDLSRA